MLFPSSLSVNIPYNLSRASFFFPRFYQSIEERYLLINYICKLEYYYVSQVYWEFAVIGVANWRQSARKNFPRTGPRWIPTNLDG
jgi:hypothetical protein